MPITKGGLFSHLHQYYDTGDDGEYSVFGNILLAQTFTPQQSHVMYCISVPAFMYFTPPYLECALQGTTPAGNPDGVDIAVRRIPGSIINWWYPAWTPFYFDDFPPLTVGVMYAFVLRAPTAIGFNAAIIRADRTLATYTNGYLLTSGDGGTTWTKKPTEDVLFREWGYTPPPDAPPPPAISNWSARDVKYYPLCDGYKIVVQTDNPYHLFMRYTTFAPQTHKIPRYRRGVFMHDDKYFCFVAWKENEQEEKGDTYEHTFIKRNWPICEVRWFYFIGSRIDTMQPSTSPIFSIHFTIQHFTVHTSPSNRSIHQANANWGLAHDAPTGTVLGAYGPPSYTLHAGEELTVQYHIYRNYLFFDLTPLSPSIPIYDGSLNIFPHNHWCTSSIAYPHLCLTQGVQHDPVIPSDYGDQLPYTDIGGWIDFRDLVDGEYNSIPLNDTGVGFLNIGGITKFCLRGEQDIVDSVPPLGSNVVWFRSQQYGVDYAPYLVLCYQYP